MLFVIITFIKSQWSYFTNKYSVISDDVFRHVTSINGKSYICKTCGRNFLKNCIPGQAVCNMLEVSELPKEFRDIQRFERVFTAIRLFFKKISIIPKDQSPNLKDALCNVPIDVVYVCKALTRPADNNRIVIVKLKRKLQHRDHVYFESVRSNFIMRLLQHLKLNNSLYHDIEINLDNVPNFIINEKSQNSLLLNVLSNIDIHEEIPIMVEKNYSREEVESDIQSKSSNTPIPIMLENWKGTQGSNLITIVTNIKKPDISSNLTSNI